jgi:hypothetical protein
MERAAARHGELAVDTCADTDVVARTAIGDTTDGDACEEGFQITAWLTPFEIAAQPAIVPRLLMATATLGLASLGLSLTIAPFASHVEATMDPEDGSKSAPTTVPFELTAVA